MRTATAGLLVVLCASSAPAAESRPAAGELRGRLVLTERGKPARDAGLDLRQAAVWFEPDGTRPRIAPVETEMATVRKQFAPQLVVVPVGSTVRFPNQDPILHNVFSVTGGNAFDLGLVGAGTGKSATFTAPGIVQVFCNVHHAMFAHVVVVATPYYVQPDDSGAFALAGLPAGGGTLRFWHERGEPAERRVVVPQHGALELELEVTLPRVPRHRNKFGKSYRRGSYE